jgi:DNA (cytosine-5)-methyltransferase 1
VRVLDLFAGAGGLSEGFRAAGYNVVAASEIDPDAGATYKLNFPEAEVVIGDVRDRSVRDRLSNVAEGCDLIVGGPPCQAFSQVRNHARLIEDPRNSLYREFVRIVSALEPKAFVMENVPGLQQMGVKEQVLEDLSLRGRYIVAAQVLDAADFGVPQSRQRMFFVGLHSSLGRVPPVIHGTGATHTLSLRRRVKGRTIGYEISERGGLFELANDLQDSANRALVTAEQAIGDLELLTAGEREDELPTASLPKPQSAYQRLMRSSVGPKLHNTSVPRINADTALRLERLPPGGNYRDLPAEMTQRYLTGALWGPSNGTGQLGRRHYYAYRRLHPGFWSWTLNTKADSVYHYRDRRALSVREFARLQSFPDRFVFVTDPRQGALPGRIDGGAAHSRYRQVGNAVPPLLAQAIARLMAKLMGAKQETRRSA